MSATRRHRLKEGIAVLATPCSRHQLDSLLIYLDMLEQWNKVFNLTAICDPMKMIGLHLLDSIAVHSYIQIASTIIDVGTGPGLPGIPLAILNPNKQFTLLDSNGKKIRFLFQVITDLGLNNVKEVNQRVEKYMPDAQFDMVVSRAFSSIPTMLSRCKHLISSDGRFLAMKGKKPETELSKMAKVYSVTELAELKVPQVTGERHLVIVKKSA